MDTRRDIESRLDIESLITNFYDEVKRDPVIGIIFTEIVPLDWDHHIPLIVDFWETILLDKPVYKRNAMDVHYKLNNIYPLKKEHFDSWLSLFYATLDRLFKGPLVELAKKRSRDIAGLMMYKMNNTIL